MKILCNNGIVFCIETQLNVETLILLCATGTDDLQVKKINIFLQLLPNKQSAIV